MYKDKNKQRQATKERLSLSFPYQGEGDTPSIYYALIDPDKRCKLEMICQALDRRNLLEKVQYGTDTVGGEAMNFKHIAEMLVVTGGKK